MIQLTDEMREALANALTDRLPVILAYVGPGGQPSISFRGTAQVYSDDQIAIWARNPEGGLGHALAVNPRIALLYRNPEKRLGWQFHGRARIVDDEAVRRTVYDNSPEPERGADPERKGKAMIVDVDRVIARGQTLMER
ncbi:MAG: pyridoxamine 5'-phosphate oxidase family protein [Dehalococcoidia bacterium]|nr:pyridoxamine 5'-phosphate oxidase family protein [Dehalococcoidia bacterium]